MKRKVLIGSFLFVDLLILLACFSVWHKSDFNPAPVFLTQAFQSEIMQKEAKLPLRPSTNKSFVWISEEQKKTPYSLVQLHGFSASRRETAPFAERLSQDLGWNLFMTRLTGHGLGAEGMATLTAELLLNDAEEALTVGERMGEKVVIFGTSTGAALGLALAEKNPQRVAAFIFFSPNFRPKDPKSLLLKGPIGALLAKYLVTQHSWKPNSEDEERYWTTSYGTGAVHELMDLLSWVNRFDLKKYKIPMLVFYTESDNVVSADLIKERFEQYGGPKLLIKVDTNHVIAGDIFSPQTTDFVLQTTKDFLRENLPDLR